MEFRSGNAECGKNEIKVKPSNFVSKSYGDTFLTRSIQKGLGLIDILKEHFKDWTMDWVLHLLRRLKGAIWKT